MWVRFDRAVVAVAELDAAVDSYARLLGREPLCFEDGSGTGARFQLGNGALELRNTPGDGELGLQSIALGVDDALECQRWLSGRGFTVRSEKREAQLRGG